MFPKKMSIIESAMLVGCGYNDKKFMIFLFVCLYLTACDDVTCARPHSQCTIVGGNARCSCFRDCKRPNLATDRVCGSDDVTYASECFMKRAACGRDRNITIKSKGPCPGLYFDFFVLAVLLRWLTGFTCFEMVPVICPLGQIK